MAYGDYDGPNKPDKGEEGGSCNRTRCQAPNAVWYNHGSYAWYCEDCRRDIEFDNFNHRHWQQDFFPRLQHPQFETREMIAARTGEKAKAAMQVICVDATGRSDLVLGEIYEVHSSDGVLCVYWLVNVEERAAWARFEEVK